MSMLVSRKSNLFLTQFDMPFFIFRMSFNMPELSGYLILHIQNEPQHGGKGREHRDCKFYMVGAIYIVIFGGTLIHVIR